MIKHIKFPIYIFSEISISLLKYLYLTQVMSGADHLGIVHYLPQPPVSGAVYATPTRYICHNTEPPSSSPLHDSQIRTRSNADCGVETFRHESSV